MLVGMEDGRERRMVRLGAVVSAIAAKLIAHNAKNCGVGTRVGNADASQRTLDAGNADASGVRTRQRREEKTAGLATEETRSRGAAVKRASALMNRDRSPSNWNRDHGLASSGRAAAVRLSAPLDPCTAAAFPTTGVG